MTRPLPTLCLIALAACGAAEDPAAPMEPPVLEPEACDLVPVVTWENFGQGFVDSYCQGCHASTAIERQGAPDQVYFDTEEDTLVWGGLILAKAASETPTMPPAGGPLPEDRERLQIWLTCFAE